MVSAKMGAAAAAANERNHCRRTVISDSLGSVALHPTGEGPHSKAARVIRLGPPASLRLRNGQHLARMNQVGVADAAGAGDLVVLVAVTVEVLGDRRQGVAGDHGVRARRWRRWRGRWWWRWWRRRWWCRSLGGRQRFFRCSRCHLGRG